MLQSFAVCNMLHYAMQPGQHAMTTTTCDCCLQNSSCAVVSIAGEPTMMSVPAAKSAAVAGAGLRHL